MRLVDRYLAIFSPLKLGCFVSTMNRNKILKERNCLIKKYYDIFPYTENSLSLLEAMILLKFVLDYLFIFERQK